MVLWKPCKGHMEPCKGRCRQRCRVPSKAAAYLPRVTDGFTTSTTRLIGLGTPTPAPNPPPQPPFSPSPRSQVHLQAPPSRSCFSEAISQKRREGAGRAGSPRPGRGAGPFGSCRHGSPSAASHHCGSADGSSVTSLFLPPCFDPAVLIVQANPTLPALAASQGCY